MKPGRIVRPVQSTASSPSSPGPTVDDPPVLDHHVGGVRRDHRCRRTRLRRSTRYAWIYRRCRDRPRPTPPMHQPPRAPDPRRDVRPRGARRSRAVPPADARRRSAAAATRLGPAGPAPSRARRHRRVAGRPRPLPSPPRPRRPTRSVSVASPPTSRAPSRWCSSGSDTWRAATRSRSSVRASAACSPARRPARSHTSSVASSRSDRPVVGGPEYTATRNRYTAASATRSGGAADERSRIPLPVPVTAIWSANDGIVSPAACIDLPASATSRTSRSPAATSGWGSTPTCGGSSPGALRSTATLRGR